MATLLKTALSPPAWSSLKAVQRLENALSFEKGGQQNPAHDLQGGSHIRVFSISQQNPAESSPSYGITEGTAALLNLLFLVPFLSSAQETGSNACPGEIPKAISVGLAQEQLLVFYAQWALIVGTQA